MSAHNLCSCLQTCGSDVSTHPQQPSEESKNRKSKAQPLKSPSMVTPISTSGLTKVERLHQAQFCCLEAVHLVRQAPSLLALGLQLAPQGALGGL